MPLKSLQGQHQYKLTLTQLNSFNLTFIEGFILRQSNKMWSYTSQSLKLVTLITDCGSKLAGWYVTYTHVRTCSLGRNCGSDLLQSKSIILTFNVIFTLNKKRWPEFWKSYLNSDSRCLSVIDRFPFLSRKNLHQRRNKVNPNCMKLIFSSPLLF